ncbi:MAG: protein-disulfide reductase DsbD family protein [Hyphomonadaceae bacterium]
MLKSLTAAVWLLFLAALTAGSPAWAQLPATAHGRADLIAERAEIVPGDHFMAALRLELEDGWHVYWKNGGESGLPPEIAWDLPDGVETGPFVWPAPEALVVAGLMNYVYEHEVILPFEVDVPDTLAPGDTLTLSGQANWLICQDICIPESAAISLNLPVGSAPQPSDSGVSAISQVLADAPKPALGDARVERLEKVFRLSIADPELAQAVAHAKEIRFFPSGQDINHPAEQVVHYGDNGVALDLEISEYADPGALPIDGVLTVKQDNGEQIAFEVDAAPGSTPDGVMTHLAGGGAGFGGASLLVLLGAAFLGGLILNLMPCVLPVLSIKAAGLVQSAHDPGEARAHGLAYLAGVLVCFVALAGVLTALRLAGEQAGLGFQLQYAPLVALFALLMFAVGLNMMGVFEIGGSLQSVGGGLAQKQGMAGAFFTGLLAGFVGAPCVGPFMGPAMGFALTQPAAVTFGFFAVVGLGMAAPFVLLSFSPALARMLPKPGKWMETFRQALSFPMFLTALWLLWVLGGQAGSTAVVLTVGGAIVLAFGIWIAKRFGSGVFGKGLAALIVVAAFALPSVLSAGMTAAPALAASDAGSDAVAEAWSPERVAELRQDGRVIFIDFTARWCVTCQVNKASIYSGEVSRAFADNNVAFLEADWTSRDEVIGAELAKHGRAGVPLYLVYPASGGEPRVLPQILTPGLIAKAVTQAAGAQTAKAAEPGEAT